MRDLQCFSRHLIVRSIENENWWQTSSSFFSRVHTTLWPALSVGRSVRQLVGKNFWFITFVTISGITAPAQSHATVQLCIRPCHYKFRAGNRLRLSDELYKYAWVRWFTMYVLAKQSSKVNKVSSTLALLLIFLIFSIMSRSVAPEGDIKCNAKTVGPSVCSSICPSVHPTIFLFGHWWRYTRIDRQTNKLHAFYRTSSFWGRCPNITTAWTVDPITIITIYNKSTKLSIPAA